MKASYCLHVGIKCNFKERVGALGILAFEKGDYVYIGSALGGLEGRIARHRRRNKKKQWHIDYLLLNRNSEIKGVYFRRSDSKGDECMMAREIAGHGIAVTGFGCSDCKCKSHLFRVSSNNLIKTLQKMQFGVLN